MNSTLHRTLRSASLVVALLCASCAIGGEPKSKSKSQPTTNRPATKSIEPIPDGVPNGEVERRFKVVDGLDVLDIVDEIFEQQPSSTNESPGAWYDFWDLMCTEWILMFDEEDGTPVPGSGQLTCFKDKQKDKLGLTTRVVPGAVVKRLALRREIVSFLDYFQLEPHQGDDTPLGLDCGEWFIFWVEDENGNVENGSITFVCDDVDIPIN